MAESSGSLSFENVPCPFCGLLCDDVEVAQSDLGLKVSGSRCSEASGFERALPEQKPQVAGQDVTLEKAVGAAAGLIGKSKDPLYGGLSTDVNGMRSVLALADFTRGTVDHAWSAIVDRNISVLQSAGWFMSTLTETRNRADVIVIAGCDVQKMHSCFFKHIVCADESMFSDIPPKRTIVFIGEGLDQSGAVGTRIGDVVTVPCPLNRVDEVLAVMLARLSGNPVRGDSVAGVPVSDIEALGERFLKASYGVMVWAPAGFETAHADLTVHTISEVVKKLNLTTRWAGLSLGGAEGAAAATSVTGWQTGFPSRVSFASGAPNYDPYLHSIPRKLSEGEGDLLLWVASISPDFSPPETKVPMIVLGTPGLKLSRQPDVFIPVGTPGIDHAGQLIRCDNVVSLPLRNLGRSQNPSVSQVLSAIQVAL